MEGKRQLGRLNSAILGTVRLEAIAFRHKRTMCILVSVAQDTDRDSRDGGGDPNGWGAIAGSKVGRFGPEPHQECPHVFFPNA